MFKIEKNTCKIQHCMRSLDQRGGEIFCLEDILSWFAK